MPDKHAKVTASGAHRWLNCPASVGLEKNFPDQGSDAAREGTKAHALAERKLNAFIGGQTNGEYVVDDPIMGEATTDYMNYVVEVFNEELAKGICSLRIEVTLDLSDWIPDGFGTSDALILSDDTLHVIDFKYGKGVQVDAHENPQMRLYALGALAMFEGVYEFTKVKTHIFQPRLDHISTEELDLDQLLEWGESIKETAKKAYYETETEGHAGEWCRFCRARQACKARADLLFPIIKDKSGLLEPQEISEILPYLDEAVKWAKEIQEYALAQALEGTEIPGFKVVEGRSNRKIADPEALADLLKNEGYEDIYKPVEMKSLTALEKLAGKKFFKDCPYIQKPKGKPALVPDTDERPTYEVKVEEMFK